MPEYLRTWDAWRDIHQPFELDWWKDAMRKGHSIIYDEPFENSWREVREWIQPHGTVIDIGCGPRPPFTPCTVIEPLADEYRKLTPASWWNGVTVHAQPAEQQIAGLKGDTIICWNAIDHAIGWREIMDSMVAYCREHSKLAIATDFWPPFDGHPGFDRSDFMSEVHKRFNVHDTREPFGRRTFAMLLTKKS